MNWAEVTYYVGYAGALFLCYGLGRLFFVPMLLNLGFNITLGLGLLSGWDIRWVMVGYGFLFFLWVLSLSKATGKTTLAVVLAVDLGIIVYAILPEIQLAGTGPVFWDATSTGIYNVWLTSILVVSLSAIVKSSVVSLMERGFSELLVVPKNRFLIPIAIWSGLIVLGGLLKDVLPSSFVQQRYDIGALLLVWGWVAFELPFYLMYKRMRRAHS